MEQLAVADVAIFVHVVDPEGNWGQGHDTDESSQSFFLRFVWV